jgi:hypothetical protein
MRSRLLAPLSIAAIASLLLALTLAGAAAGAETTLSTTLQGGAAEVPPGDPDGSGTATIRLDPATGMVCWNMTTTNIAAATISHIHEGAAGVAGPVRVNLDVDGFDGSTEGCTSGVSAEQINAIIANPAGFYVNVHNAEYMGGAVRGQLAAAATTAPSTSTGSLAGGTSALTALGLALLGVAALGFARRLATEARA